MGAAAVTALVADAIADVDADAEAKLEFAVAAALVRTRFMIRAAETRMASAVAAAEARMLAAIAEAESRMVAAVGATLSPELIRLKRGIDAVEASAHERFDALDGVANTAGELIGGLHARVFEGHQEATRLRTEFGDIFRRLMALEEV